MFQLLTDAGSPVPLSVLLGNHTIEQLAAQLGSGTGTGTDIAAVPRTTEDLVAAEDHEAAKAREALAS